MEEHPDNMLKQKPLLADSPTNRINIDNKSFDEVTIKEAKSNPTQQAPHHGIRWFYMCSESGVLSFGLTQITLVFVIIIQISFAIMFTVSCKYGFNKCAWDTIPMISDVIADPIFDRVFILLNTAYFIGIHQVNVRSLYSRFHGIISDRQNNRLFYVGLVSSFSLPMIGVFDNRRFVIIHKGFALIFFSSSAFYLSMIAYLKNKHREELLGQLSSDTQRASEDNLKKWGGRIMFNYQYSKLCSLVVIVLFACVGTLGDSFWLCALLEWTCVFLYMTLTMLIMSALPCYDQITLSFHVKNKINASNNGYQRVLGDSEGTSQQSPEIGRGSQEPVVPSVSINQ